MGKDVECWASSCLFLFPYVVVLWCFFRLERVERRAALALALAMLRYAQGWVVPAAIARVSVSVQQFVGALSPVGFRTDC